MTDKKNNAPADNRKSNIDLDTIFNQLMPLIQKQPAEVQIQILWIKLQELMSEVEQLKAYHYAAMKALESFAESLNERVSNMAAVKSASCNNLKDLIQSK